ncbi:MAG: T9SS type A sorting domain-containing protein [Bacteroidales bacterium]|nr:T9SS type A sorting domain-containing protein [Bacteroidales bacterium]
MKSSIIWIRNFGIICIILLKIEIGNIFSQDFSIVGWATVNAEGYNGTTGGQGGVEVTVKTATEFQAAINDKSDGPLIIYVEGILTHDDKIDIKYISDISIIGRGDNAELNGFGVNIREANNIIVRNLKIHHVIADRGDAVGIDRCHHVWIDHCELYSDMVHDKDYYDGLLDIKNGSRYITASWNIIHDHYKTSLIGSTDDASQLATDSLFKITYHHNYFHNTNSRNPSLRFGRLHAFNNYYKDIDSYCIAVRKGAHAIVENNHFESCGTPVTTTFGDGPDGFACLSNNLYSGTSAETDNDISQTDCSWNVPYAYVLDNQNNVKDLVVSNSGVGIIDTTKVHIYTITVQIEGEGSVSPNGGSYTEGVDVNLTANPAQGWLFDKWSGDIDNANQTITLTVNSDLSIIAQFTELPVYNLTVNIEGEGNVFPSERSFHEGDEMNFIAVPSAGWKFEQWKGDITETDSIIEITFNSDVNITAEFSQIVSIFAHENKENIIYQNFPNPFNEYTYLNLSLNTNTHVKVDLLDISGKYLKNVTSDIYSAGDHSIYFNRDGIESGVYLFKIFLGQDVYYSKLVIK